VGEAAADAGQFVGCHDGALAGAAYEHGPVGGAGEDYLAGRAGDVREIDWVSGVGAAVGHFVSESLNGLADGVLERISGVVCAEGDLQRMFLS
jgi:hypothetical protein